MPAAMVSTALCRTIMGLGLRDGKPVLLHHATAPATSAATSLAFPGPSSRAPGETKAIDGTMIAVTIATGTCFSASASHAGIAPCEQRDERHARRVGDRADRED